MEAGDSSVSLDLLIRSLITLGASDRDLQDHRDPARCIRSNSSTFEISKDSRDHSREVYEEVIMPGFRRMNPAPKIALTRFGAGVHSFWKAEKDLPVGIAPSVLRHRLNSSLRPLKFLHRNLSTDMKNRVGLQRKLSFVLKTYPS